MDWSHASLAPLTTDLVHVIFRSFFLNTFFTVLSYAGNTLLLSIFLWLHFIKTLRTENLSVYTHHRCSAKILPEN